MKFIRSFLLWINFLFKSVFFLRYIPDSFLYSLRRDRAESNFRDRAKSGSLISPGRLLEAVATEQGGQFRFEQAELEIDFLLADLVRINWRPGLPPIPYALVEQEWEPVETTLKQTSEGWTIASEAMQMTVSPEGGLTVVDAAGKMLRKERSPQRQGERWIHQADLMPDEQIYGLGERASSLNLRTVQDATRSVKTYRMWNYDPGGRYPPGTDPMYICIPVYLGFHQAGSYLVFYENSFRAEFTFAERATADFEGGSLRYYLTTGEPAHLLERYTQLTGRPPMPARWALGYHQSRWGYRTEAAIRQEVEEFQAHDLPLSAIHFDIDCQADHRPFTLDPQRFPQVSRFTQELIKQGVRCIAINNPGIKYSRQSNLFLEGCVLEAFCTYPDGALVVAPVWAGRMVFPDFTNPKVRDWWSRQYAYLLDVGITGFWHDMNEPAAFVLWGDHTLPSVAQHCLEGRRGDHREAHNVYGFLEARAGYESLRRYRPNQRPFIVSRSGWAGLQRYAWTWTGDTICTWAAMRQTIATVIGLGLSGIPFTGPDIGGFQGNPSPELYLRWFQMATFLMFYRTHSSTSVQPRTPWAYGEPYLSIIRSYLQLRYQLMPYLYTLAWEASQKGYPPVRSLFWLDWGDRTLRDIDDAFCLGDALLVCPVLGEGHRNRSVTLPDGEWYNFWNDHRISGGRTIEVDAPLEQMPVLVKAGSVLPMEDLEQQQLTLHLYPSSSGEGQGYLYSDAGDGEGEFRIDRFSFSRRDQILELYWDKEGDYAFAYASVQLQVHGLSVQQAWVDGAQGIPGQGMQITCGIFERICLECAE
ncbi:glycoside hydrolase family 31 protein [Egbenema bharatensis]|uniref:glycoside hydrolase family 31 protein n=1 Tax=Egbenema bharatensis TaxID=3463334 RepID=UPI003A8AD8D1